jgi:hypothetical protein
VSPKEKRLCWLIVHPSDPLMPLLLVPHHRNYIPSLDLEVKISVLFIIIIYMITLDLVIFEDRLRQNALALAKIRKRHQSSNFYL